MNEIAHRIALAAHGILHGALSRLPRNDLLWSRVFRGSDGSAFMTRTIFPRVLGRRLLIHRLWRADSYPCHHNHPWRSARFVVACGGYTEDRIDDVTGVTMTETAKIGDSIYRVTSTERTLGPGNVNAISATDFHRVVSVKPGTITLGIVGEECQDWGFMVDGVFVPHDDYFARIATSSKVVNVPDSSSGKALSIIPDTSQPTTWVKLPELNQRRDVVTPLKMEAFASLSEVRVLRDGMVVDGTADKVHCWMPQWAERLASFNPDHDWRIEYVEQYRTLRYQRHGVEYWALVSIEEFRSIEEFGA